MLRNCLLGVALVAALFGLFALFCLGDGQTKAWPMVFWGTGLFIVILVERWRYRRIDRDYGTDTDWQATDEQFVDPETGQLTKVLYKSATGERRYVPADD